MSFNARVQMSVNFSYARVQMSLNFFQRLRSDVNNFSQRHSFHKLDIILLQFSSKHSDKMFFIFLSN